VDRAIFSDTIDEADKEMRSRNNDNNNKKKLLISPSFKAFLLLSQLPLWHAAPTRRSLNIQKMSPTKKRRKLKRRL